MNRYFVICDRDKGYVERLTAFFSQKRLLPYRIQGITDPDALEGFCRSSPVALLLAEDEILKGRKERFPAERQIALTAAPGQEDAGRLFKFQAAPDLARKLLQGQETGMSSGGPGKMKLIGVYSPGAYSQRTLFAFAMAQILSKTQKALYLHFGSFSGLQKLLSVERESDLTDVLYLIRQGRRQTELWAGDCIQKLGELDYILPAVSPMDLQGAEEEDFLAVLDAVEDRGGYQTAVLEFDEGCPAFWPLLKRCGVIYLLTGEDALSRAKAGQYTGRLQDMGHQDILSKTVPAAPPYYRPYNDSGAYMEQLVWSELGDYIRGLLPGG